MNIKKSLALAKLGYDLLDRKRNILVREMMELISSAEEIQNKINETYLEAYRALQNANITLGLVADTVSSFPYDDTLQIDYRSVMGVELPVIRIDKEQNGDKPERPVYSLMATNSQFDDAYLAFVRVKRLTVLMTQVETSIYRLANAVKKTQKRSNALQNIIIPNFEANIVFITNYLAEKEREEFSRLKIVKAGKLEHNV